MNSTVSDRPPACLWFSTTSGSTSWAEFDFVWVGIDWAKPGADMAAAVLVSLDDAGELHVEQVDLWEAL